MPSKADRTALHQIIRELFEGKLQTEAKNIKDGESGPRISLEWNHRGACECICFIPPSINAQEWSSWE